MAVLPAISWLIKLWLALSMYISIMFFITIDRLLEFKLNINYPLYWRPKKTVTTTTAIFAVFTAVFACTFVLNRLKILKCHSYVFVLCCCSCSRGVFSISWLYVLCYFPERIREKEKKLLKMWMLSKNKRQWKYWCQILS